MGQPDPGDDVPGMGDRDQRVLPDAIGDQPERQAGQDRETDEGEQPAIDLPAADADRGGCVAHGVVHGPKPSRWPSGLGHPPIVRVGVLRRVGSRTDRGPACNTARRPRPSGGTVRHPRLVLAIFILSGAAGLMYEVVWSRQLVLVFGNTTQAVSTILTGFFGGLAIGSFLGGRLADRVRSPLRLYGVIELILVVVVLLTPVTFNLLHELYRGIYPVDRGRADRPRTPAVRAGDPCAGARDRADGGDTAGPDPPAERGPPPVGGVQPALCGEHASARSRERSSPG